MVWEDMHLTGGNSRQRDQSRNFFDGKNRITFSRPWRFVTKREESLARPAGRSRCAIRHPNLFSVLGVNPIFGTSVCADDGREGQPRRSHPQPRLWQRRYAAISISSAAT